MCGNKMNKNVVPFVLAVTIFQNILNSQCSANFLNVQTFKESDRSRQSQFVMFYAPWCSHCKELLPTWNQLADKSEQNKMKISKVNCLEETAFCSDQNILAYPTLSPSPSDDDCIRQSKILACRMKMFHDGDTIRFDGRRTLSELEIFIGQILNNKLEIKEEDGLLTLTSENFDAHIKQGVGLHFVDFYAPWCIHCKRFEPTWKAIAEHYKDNPDITIGKIDCTVETSKCQKWGIGGFPTLDLFQNGERIDSYKGNRNLEELKSYINEMLYQNGLIVDSEARERKETDQRDSTFHAEQDEIVAHAVVEVHDKTFDMLVSEDSVFINFYTPWSTDSNEFDKTWKNLGILCQKEGLITIIAQMDCSRYSEICKRYQIFTYPTLVFFKQGTRHYYKKERTLKDLHNFVKQHRHREL